MNVYVASDHAGFELKAALVPFLKLLGHEVADMGPFSPDPTDDYPDFMLPLAHKVAGEEGSVGIVIGGSGQGEAMACNRVRGVRAAVYYGGNPEIIKLMRAHNNANVLSLGARFMGTGEAEEALRTFLSTPFSADERHIRRIGKLDA